MKKYWDERCISYRCPECDNLTLRDRCLNCEDIKLENQTSMTINELVDKVRKFQVAKGFPDSVELDDTAYLMFRNALLVEEISELFTAIYNKNELEIADGLADVIYIVIGTCVILNMPIGELLEEVHRSNMTKDQGAVKGKNYESPDIKRILGAK